MRLMACFNRHILYIRVTYSYIKLGIFILQYCFIYHVLTKRRMTWHSKICMYIMYTYLCAVKAIPIALVCIVHAGNVHMHCVDTIFTHINHTLAGMNWYYLVKLYVTMLQVCDLYPPTVTLLTYNLIFI
jgi:hypothetical protein